MTNLGETLLGNPTPATASGAPLSKCTLSNISTGGTNCYARKIYRSKVDETVLRYLATVNDNVSTVYVDTASDDSLGSESLINNNSVDPALNLGGVLNIQGFVKASFAPGTIAFADINDGVTCNGAFNKILITDAITADLGTSDLIVLNNYVSVNSSIFATVQTVTGVFASISAISAGTYTLSITNVTGSALNSDITIATQIIN